VRTWRHRHSRTALAPSSLSALALVSRRDVRPKSGEREVAPRKRRESGLDSHASPGDELRGRQGKGVSRTVCGHAAMVWCPCPIAVAGRERGRVAHPGPRA
jgi:hypothetical protein